MFVLMFVCLLLLLLSYCFCVYIIISVRAPVIDHGVLKLAGAPPGPRRDVTTLSVRGRRVRRLLLPFHCCAGLRSEDVTVGRSRLVFIFIFSYVFGVRRTPNQANLDLRRR